MPSADMEKSPSPPPAPPIQSTPGPRAQALTKVYTNALESTLNSVSYPSFSACFPSIAKNAPKQLEAMHKGMCERLRAFAMGEFGEIMEERRVVERLNELEGLIADARKRKSRSVEGGEGKGEGEVAPHTLPPAPLVNAHLTPLYRSQQSQLNARLQTTQSQNASLIEVLRRQRQEIEELVKMAERVVGDLESAGTKLAKESEVLSEAARAEEVLRNF